MDGSTSLSLAGPGAVPVAIVTLGIVVSMGPRPAVFPTARERSKWLRNVERERRRSELLNEICNERRFSESEARCSGDSSITCEVSCEPLAPAAAMAAAVAAL